MDQNGLPHDWETKESMEEDEILSSLHGLAISPKDLLGLLNSHNFPIVPLWAFGEKPSPVLHSPDALSILFSPVSALRLARLWHGFCCCWGVCSNNNYHLSNIYRAV